MGNSSGFSSPDVSFFQLTPRTAPSFPWDMITTTALSVSSSFGCSENSLIAASMACETTKIQMWVSVSLNQPVKIHKNNNNSSPHDSRCSLVKYGPGAERWLVRTPCTQNPSSPWGAHLKERTWSGETKLLMLRLFKGWERWTRHITDKLTLESFFSKEIIMKEKALNKYLSYRTNTFRVVHSNIDVAYKLVHSITIK